MTHASDLRFDFIDWTARRLGLTRQDVQHAVSGFGAVATVTGTYGDPKQERRHGQEPREGSPRQERLACA